MAALRIMVVDDCPMLAVAIAKLVRDFGHEAEAFTDGSGAVAAYGGSNWHMVIVDQRMPGMDGLAVMRALRQHQQQSGWRPILMVSAFSSAEEQVAALHAGCDDFLPKPVSAAVLAAKIAAFARIFDLQEQLASQNRTLLQFQADREEEARVAEQLMKRLVLRAELDRKVLQHFVRATAQMSGDLILATSSSTGDRYVMLADATGHGLPAALTQIPLSQTFYEMAARGFSPVSIVAEMNRHHRQYAPVYRSVAAFVAVHRVREQTLEVWNGGMPDALLVESNGQVVRRFKSQNLPLGIDSDMSYYRDSEVVAVVNGHHLVLCSDGVFEAENSLGDWFGGHGVEDALLAAGTAGGFGRAVEEALDRHLAGHRAHDDLSCMILDCSPCASDMALPRANGDEQVTTGNHQWQLEIALGGARLRQFDLVPSMIAWLRELGLADGDVARLSLVMGELVTNAIDHGLLGLDSGLKNGPDGWERYATLREQRLDQLANGSLTIKVRQSGPGELLQLQVQDSGDGFHWQGRQGAQAQDYHGRGLQLVCALSNRLEYRGAGNDVFVEIASASAAHGAAGPRGGEQQ
ncbi:MAG: SpoIIE family protein phosphatase [Gammaproteobacteria bacterium]|nr:SpoIIE family protein phosphatase [Gammaproteobacteria bacterium]